MAQSTEESFQINIPDSEIELLHRKLELVRFPDELEGAKWDYGVPLADIQRLTARWKNGYDWRQFEAKLNQLPMFTRDITIEGHGTLNIHYIHQKSAVGEAIPLLFVHGCMLPVLYIYISASKTTLIVDFRAWELHRMSQDLASLDCIQ